MLDARWWCLWLGVALAMAGLCGCARDVNPPTTEDRYPASIKLHFRTRGPLQDDTWYYFVFNFTAAPSTASATAPFDDLSTKDRGRNWEMYAAYRRNAETGAEFTMLQRPAQPTVLTTEAGPVDAAVGDYNSDAINDIAVACRTAGIVQVILGRLTDIYDVTYFENPERIPAADGPAPLLLQSGNIAGTEAPDLLVFYGAQGADSAFMRVLLADADGVFTQFGNDIVLGGTPVDAILRDFNNDQKLDLALLTTGSVAGQTMLRIYTGDGAGTFTKLADHPVGVNPVALAAGALDDQGPADLVVGNHGSGAGDSNFMLFYGGDDAAFTAGPTVAVTIGPIDGLAVGRFFGQGDDVAVTFIGDYTTAPGGAVQTGGLVAVYQKEPAETFLPEPTLAALGVNPPGVKPNAVAALDTGDDTFVDAVVLGGQPGSNGKLLYIQRGGREAITGTLNNKFAWTGDTITYLTELEPSRLRLADIDKNGVADFIIPCPAGGSGERICLYYGLGRSNYTSADIYWTDGAPALLAGQQWLLSPMLVGQNSLELNIDPLLFYDLALQPVDIKKGFNVDFMTGTSGIDLQHNQNRLGEVRDHLNSPINIVMEPGWTMDEQQVQRATQYQAANPSEDVDYYFVEVN